MPELDFAGLRQDAEHAYRPHFETVRRRARQRRRRRAGIAALGVACVVAAGGALYTQVGHGGGQSAAAGGDIDDRWGIQVGDLDHLYAPYERCGQDHGCSDPGLLVSTDRGKSWHAGASPTVPDRWAMMAFRTLGPQTLVIVGFTAPTYLVSTDAGTSWRATEPGPAVPALPDGWRLVTVEPVPNQAAGMVQEYSVIVGDPVTGTLAPLANHLHLGIGRPAVTMPDSAGLWAAGAAGLSGPQAVAVSRDRGTSWQVTPVGPAGDQDLAILGYGQGAAYVAVQPRGRGAPADLYKSVDNGASWQKITTDTHPPGNANVLNGLVLDDGRILVPGAIAQGPGEPTPTPGQRGLFASTDGGRTFQQTNQLPGAYVLYRVTGGYAAATPGAGIWLSRDGTDWVAVARPYLR
jgi:photosystem II stability/assembly factor-like uncharacterized protein